MELWPSEQHLEAVYGGDVVAASDGTFSVSLEPWFDLPMPGFATRLHALRAAHAADEAMREYGRNAAMDD